MNRAAARLNLRPIDDRARDGSFQLVTDGWKFSVARWDGKCFVYCAGTPVSEFVPSHFHVPAEVRFDG